VDREKDGRRARRGSRWTVTRTEIPATCPATPPPRARPPSSTRTATATSRSSFRDTNHDRRIDTVKYDHDDGRIDEVGVNRDGNGRLDHAYQTGVRDQPRRLP
jgi:hypothetical protein